MKIDDNENNPLVICTILSTYQVVLIGKPASFQWRENSTAIIILLLSFSENEVVVKTRYQMLEVSLFCDREIRGLNEDNSANFFGEENEAFSGLSIF